MNILKIILNSFPLPTAYAHCDIPCGIYDPNALQQGAHTVLRMTQLFEEHKESMHDLARIVRVKEKHGEVVEDEAGTLENDYFKDEHYEVYPELKDLLKKVVKLSIETRQHVDATKAEELVETALLISEIFYKTKGMNPVRVPSVYPTKGEFVTYSA